jgi:transposase-like protein
VPVTRLIEQLSLREFQERFATEDACVQFMARSRWPDGFVCPKCQNSRGYWVGSRRAYECSSCGYQASVTAGTALHRSRVPLRLWFWAMYLCATDKRGVSAAALQAKIGVSYPTAWFMLHRIRRAMADRDSGHLLSGDIDLDDAYVGGKSKATPGTNNKSGFASDKARVMVALSLREGRPESLRLGLHTGPVNSAGVLAFAQATIADGSHVVTDASSVYNVLTKRSLTHTPKTYYREGHQFLKWLHVVVSNLKAFINGTYHGLSRAHLQAYLDEFAYRFSRRRDHNGLFSRLVCACCTTAPYTWRALVGSAQRGVPGSA